MIYDQASGRLVKQVILHDGSKPYKVSGLVNGRLYAVTASFVKNITINKGGQKLNVPFYSSESARTLFVPMSPPFNAKIAYPATKNPTSATVSCTADEGVTGIKIYYRETGTAGWTEYEETKPGQFSYNVPGTGRKYDFLIQKYKILNKSIYLGPSVILNGR